MVAITHSVALTGFTGTLIEVETDISQGLPGLSIVGMGNKSVQEAVQRVRSALKHSDLPLPPRKFTVNLAPADLPKTGAHYDLAIAISLLVATGILHRSEVAGCLFYGELSLTGDIKPTRGSLFAAEVATSIPDSAVFLPADNITEARYISGGRLYPVRTLKEVFLHLKKIHLLTPDTSPTYQTLPSPVSTIDDLIGQQQAKRALIIALAGHHHLFLIGPPGVGKTMLATIAPSLLPPLNQSQIVDILKLALLSGISLPPDGHPPLRTPHHTVTTAALIGDHRGKPGEISLAHHGILFLDELGEYRQPTLEALRQPLEKGQVTVGSGRYQRTIPAGGLTIAATNPCPCGYFGDQMQACRCSEWQRRRYLQRVSGPLIERFDLFIRLQREQEIRTNLVYDKQHVKVVKLIKSARDRQKKRYKSSNSYNGNLPSPQALVLEKSMAATQLLERATTRYHLSLRAQVAIIKIARTIADLAGDRLIEDTHLAEAIQLRMEHRDV